MNVCWHELLNYKAYNVLIVLIWLHVLSLGIYRDNNVMRISSKYFPMMWISTKTFTLSGYISSRCVSLLIFVAGRSLRHLSIINLGDVSEKMRHEHCPSSIRDVTWEAIGWQRKHKWKWRKSFVFINILTTADLWPTARRFITSVVVRDWAS